MSRIARAITSIVALFYTYGALVHVMNIAGLSGFNWFQAPLKWQVLDVFYLVIDVVVAVGFFTARQIAFPAFYVAAISQIALYTVLRNWIIDVPAEFAVSPEQLAYLDILVSFHLVTIVLVSMAWWMSRNVQIDQA